MAQIGQRWIENRHPRSLTNRTLHIYSPDIQSSLSIFHELPWSLAKLRLKTFGEIRVIGESYHIHDFGHCKFILRQEHGCFLQTYRPYIFYR